MRAWILGYGFRQIKKYIFNKRSKNKILCFFECNFQIFIMGLDSQTKLELVFGPISLHMLFFQGANDTNLPPFVKTWFTCSKLAWYIFVLISLFQEGHSKSSKACFLSIFSIGCSFGTSNKIS